MNKLYYFLGFFTGTASLTCYAGQSVTHFSHIVPEGKMSQFQLALIQTTGSDQVDQVTELLGGLSTSHLYRISTAGKEYVLRLLDDKSDRSEVENHFSMHRLAAEAGIAPEICYESANDGILLMKFIENRPLTLEDRMNPSTYMSLAKLVRKVHELPAFSKSEDIFERIYKSAESLKESIPNTVEGVISKLDVIRNILKTMGQNEKTSCHYDLNVNNILFDGQRFWLIDWELSALGDPAFDLATISNFYINHPEIENLYLSTYFGQKPTELELQRYQLMKLVSFVFYGLESIKRSHLTGAQSFNEDQIGSLPSLPEYYARIAEGKVDLASPEELQRFGVVMLNQVLSTSLNAQNSEQVYESSELSKL
jgi:thiamine kinase-like enzyme